MVTVSIDIGGTFTDIIVIDEEVYNTKIVGINKKSPPSSNGRSYDVVFPINILFN